MSFGGARGGAPARRVERADQTGRRLAGGDADACPWPCRRRRARRGFLARPPAFVWSWPVGSALVHAACQDFLSRAYDHGDGGLFAGRPDRRAAMGGAAGLYGLAADADAGGLCPGCPGLARAAHLSRAVAVLGVWHGPRRRPALGRCHRRLGDDAGAHRAGHGPARDLDPVRRADRLAGLWRTHGPGKGACHPVRSCSAWA